MAQEYWCKRESGVFGPASIEDCASRLEADDVISNSPEGPWARLGDNPAYQILVGDIEKGLELAEAQKAKERKLKDARKDSGLKQVTTKKDRALTKHHKEARDADWWITRGLVVLVLSSMILGFWSVFTPTPHNEEGFLNVLRMCGLVSAVIWGVAFVFAIVGTFIGE